MNTFEQNWKKRMIHFLAAQTISLFGSSLVQYAIIWYITLTTQSGIMMTISTICGYLPQILISLFAGTWVDRYNRKHLIMISDSLIATSTLIIAILFLMGYDSVYLLFLVLLVRSAGTGVQNPAVNAMIPQIVPKEHLMRVNGINSTINSLIMFLSPALSGALLTFFTIEATFFIDVITAIVGVGIMFTIPIVKQDYQKVEGKSTKNDLKEVFIYLKKHNFIRFLIAYLLIIMILISPAAFFTPLLISRTFGLEVWRLTVSEMTFSIGAVMGGLLIASWGGFKERFKMIVFSTVFYGALMIGIGLSPIYLIYLGFNCLIGISMPCFNAPVNVLIQEEVEPAMHGRVFSLMQIANACSLPLGTVLFGPLADYIKIQYILIACGSTVILIAIIAWIYHKRK